MSDTSEITPQQRDAIVQALRAGVVPRLGLHHIQVGRARELEAVIGDLDRVACGGAALRFVIGQYGAGKTLLLNLLRLIALERDLAVVCADLGPSRRLHAKGGEARLLYGDLVASMATRAMPEGGALSSVIEHFVSESLGEAQRRKLSLSEVVDGRLNPLHELPFGYAFADVLARYALAFESGDRAGKTAAMRWLRGEYSTRAEARAALGAREFIDDGRLYDGLKLLARFVAICGYGGLLVALDEMVNLYKLGSHARAANHEQLLHALNDVLQGRAAHIGFLLGGTPEFLTDRRRGLYSYPALESRLAQNRFARDGRFDGSGPVIPLENLTPEHLFILLTKIRRVFGAGKTGAPIVPDEALVRFMEYCSTKLGEAYFRTPRQTVTAFINFHSVIEQNPQTHWQDLLGGVDIAPETSSSSATSDSKEIEAGFTVQDDDLVGFRL
ncbi:MAG TPA: ATP-binding protein [Stellaceae bacterium]|nr:ATP-binding protein [Stellaceae bacterium]